MCCFSGLSLKSKTHCIYIHIYTCTYIYIYIYINTYAIVPHVVFGYSLLFTLICTSISCVLVKCYTSIIAIIAIIINHQSSYHCIYILYIYIYTILYYTIHQSSSIIWLFYPRCSMVLEYLPTLSPKMTHSCR